MVLQIERITERPNPIEMQLPSEAPHCTLDWLVQQLTKRHIPISKEVLSELRQREQTMSEDRIKLFGQSWLAYLPEKSPIGVPLHSLEATLGVHTEVRIGDTIIGGSQVVLIAGPCALETEDQIKAAAQEAHVAGAKGLRGGAFKPRTSPYSFQGLGREGLALQRREADRLGMFVVTEATSETSTLEVAEFADVIQIGARNSQNFEHLVFVALVAALTDKVILYKRGAGMSLEEFCGGAEYLLAAGGIRLMDKVVLCERGTILGDNVDIDDRGIRSLRSMTHLPVIGDPTHARKKAEQVPEAAERAIKAGADGLIIEEHPNPLQARCDNARALSPGQLEALIASKIDEWAPAGRHFKQFTLNVDET